MATTKKIKEFELERGFIIKKLSDKEAERSVTLDEFNEILKENFGTSAGFDPKGRIDWLKANKHAITRDNISDPTLEGL